MVKIVNFAKCHRIFSGFALFIIALILALPTLSKLALQDYLLTQAQAQGVTHVSVESLRFNPFTGALSLNQLKMLKQPNDFAHINQLHLKIKLSELLNARIWIESIEISDALIPIEQTSDFKMLIAGLALPKRNDDTDQTSALMLPIGVQNLQLNHVTFALSSPTGQGRYDITRLHLNDLYTWETHYARLILNSTFNDSPLNANLQLHLFAKHPKLVGTLKLSQLNLTQLQDLLKPFTPEHSLGLSGELSTDLTLTLETTDSGLHYYQTGHFTLDNSQIFQAQTTQTRPIGHVKQLHWQGDVHFFNEAIPKLFIKGDVQAKQFKLNQTAQSHYTFDTLKAQLNLHGVFDALTTFKQTGKVTLTGLGIEQADQTLALANTTWNGNVVLSGLNTADKNQPLKVVAKGDLNVQKIQHDQREPDTTGATHHAKTQVNQARWNGQATYQAAAQTINTNGHLSVSNVDVTQATPTSQNTLALNQADWNGKIDLQNGQDTKVSALGKLTLNALKSQQSVDAQTLSDLTADIAAELNAQAQLSHAGFNLTQQGAIMLSNAALSQAPFTAQLTNAQWQGQLSVAQNNVLNPSLPTAAPSAITLKANGALSLVQAALQHGVKNGQKLQQSQQASVQITQLAQLNVQNIDIQSLENITLTQLNASDFILGAATPSSPGLVKLNAVTLDTAQWQASKLPSQSPTQLTLGNLVLRDSQTDLTLDANYQPIHINALLDRLNPARSKPTLNEPTSNQPTSSNSANKHAALATPAKTPSSLNYQLASLTATGQHSIKLTALATEPALIKNVVLTKFTLGPIDSTQPNQDTPYTLNAKIDEFSQFISQGEVQPLNATLGLNSKSQLDSLSLTEYSGLVEQAIGYQIRSGQLSGKFTTLIKDGQLNAQNDINLNKLELRRSDAKTAQAFEKEFSMPLESGLALLQDKSGNIKLSLPVSGDANNPNFDIGGVISKAMNSALMTASRTYLLLALQPFGAIALAGEFVADQMAAVKLQPITFTPGKDSLSGEMQQYLTKINTLLKERKDIQIKLCGGASEADRPALKNAIKPGFNESDTQPMDIDDAQLEILAIQRQNHIKRQLMQLGTPSKQVIICQPNINPNADTPQVDVGI
ncbi:DUF748 domain-containing protein [Thiomicrorhabdus aquaedulcis]|uniref:DUF748 domain-containing protein n=1 Tax=Thiomicrorhabdus aquaedulcis TaxID=2211106 RepID=UPI000FD6EA2F|nr:DUF748 domain-containing protein [Thiomicrorhabdus aquaedulcis]